MPEVLGLVSYHVVMPVQATTDHVVRHADDARAEAGLQRGAMGCGVAHKADEGRRGHEQNLLAEGVGAAVVVQHHRDGLDAVGADLGHHRARGLVQFPTAAHAPQGGALGRDPLRSMRLVV